MTDTNIAQGFAGAIAAGIAIWFFWGGGLERQTEAHMTRAYSKVSSDAIERYEIARDSGNKIDACAHAGLVAAAFLQAKDADSYSHWKKVEAARCSEAGVPQ